MITDVVVPLIFTVVISTLVYAIGFRLALLGTIVFEAVTFSVGFVLTQGLRNLGIRKMLPFVSQMARATRQGPSRGFLESFVIEELQRITATVRGLVQDGYKPDPPEAMASFFERFFREGGGAYTGVDSHLPSDYVRTYDWFLKIQANHTSSGDTRIVVASQTDLSDDYFAYEQIWKDFVRWHREHNVNLRWIDPEVAKRLQVGHRLATTDVSLWPSHAVQFILDEDGKPSISMVFPDDPAQQTKLTTVLQFVRDVTEASAELQEGPPGIEVMNPELAAKWELYVDPDARLDRSGPMARFLLRALSGTQYVLDAAAGIGSESVLLINTALLSVVSNEVDASLRSVAREFAARHQCSIDLRKHPWERLPMELPGNFRFDAILVLGNSLCLTMQKSRRKQTITNFIQLLKPGGLLVVDERNFQALLDNREAIMDDPYENFAPLRLGDPLYRGMRVRAYPAQIDDECVAWRFFDNDPRATSSDEIRRRPQLGKDMQLHPFRSGELYGLLRECGFTDDIQVFVDLSFLETLHQGDDMPTVGDAAFVTYVARRPVAPH